MSKWPDFVIIGSMKCGTTALWRNLDKHPQITMARNPLDPKKTGVEIRFWNNGAPTHCWRKGTDWYKSLFSGQCSGEKCANYIESPRAMQRLASHIPDVKLIHCVREPISRCWSEFWMHQNIRKPEKAKKFVRFCRRYGPRVRGNYYAQLQRSIIPFFRREQIYFMIQERMRANLTEEMNKLYAWLGLQLFSADTTTVPFANRDAPTGGYRDWVTGYPDNMPKEAFLYLREYYQSEGVRFFEYVGEEITEWRR